MSTESLVRKVENQVRAYTNSTGKRLKLQFHKQETTYSCVPACLRMVLSGFGLDLSEAELGARCDCTVFGTDAFQTVNALRELGFPRRAVS